MMKPRVVYECAPPRRRFTPAQVLTPAVALLIAAAVLGEWACAPRVRTAAAATPSAASAFVGTAQAAPLSAQQQLPAGSGSATAATATPVPIATTVGQLDTRLASDVVSAAASESAIREREARAAAEAFPVRDRREMSSTMYCLKGQMRTGVRTRDGMAAGDPRVLPLGSVVRVSHPDGRLIGIFVIMDTGGAIHGDRIDLYVDSCSRAEAWGRHPVVAEVLDIGIKS
jgi:3D (Asp-Asp-Asp) domain-containing protein